MAQATAHDIWERMALVPRVLEARGPDATPVLQEKSLNAERFRRGQYSGYYFARRNRSCCDRQSLVSRLEKRVSDAMSCFSELLRKYRIVIFKGAINTDARIQAGFTHLN